MLVTQTEVMKETASALLDINNRLEKLEQKSNENRN